MCVWPQLVFVYHTNSARWQPSPHHQHQQHQQLHLHRAAGSSFWATVTDRRVINSTTRRMSAIKGESAPVEAPLGQRPADNTLQRAQRTHAQTHTHSFYQAHSTVLENNNTLMKGASSESLGTNNGQEKGISGVLSQATGGAQSSK